MHRLGLESKSVLQLRAPRAVGDRARGCIDRDVTVTITCASLSQAKWSPCWCRAINSELHELPRATAARMCQNNLNGQSAGSLPVAPRPTPG